MLPRRPLILFLSVAVLLAGGRPSPSSYACTDAIRCMDIAPRAPIKIGVIQNLTGMGPSGLGMAPCVKPARDDRAALEAMQKGGRQKAETKKEKKL
jgi:hypothetical protein